VGGDRTDFFISHAGTDRAWAEWVAWQLAEAGYTVELAVWDWTPGRNVVTAMSDTVERCDRVVALFSAAYFDRSRYATEEWTAVMAHVAGKHRDRLVPVRIEEVPQELVPALLRPLVFCDLFELDADQARQVLLDAARRPRLRADRIGHVDQLDTAAAVRRQPGQRPVAAFQAEAQRALVRFAAEDEAVGGGVPPARGSLPRAGPAERGAQDLHGELLAARFV